MEIVIDIKLSVDHINERLTHLETRMELMYPEQKPTRQWGKAHDKESFEELEAKVFGHEEEYVSSFKQFSRKVFHIYIRPNYIIPSLDP